VKKLYNFFYLSTFANHLHYLLRKIFLFALTLYISTSIFMLAQAYPNPFNPSTTIRYAIPKSAYVKMSIYDMLGRVVANLVDGTQSPNSYTVQWHPTDLGSGVYLCRIYAQSVDGSSSFTATKKLLFIK